MTKRISARQFGILRYFIDREATVGELGSFNSTTLGSLIRRVYLERRENRVVCMTSGVEASRHYNGASPVYRERAAELGIRRKCMRAQRAVSLFLV